MLYRFVESHVFVPTLNLFRLNFVSDTHIERFSNHDNVYIRKLCEPCRRRKLAVHENSTVERLRYLVQLNYPRKINRDLDTLYKDTLECIVVCKAFKDAIIIDSPHCHLKKHLKTELGKCDDVATPLANRVNEGSKVYEGLDTIEFNRILCNADSLTGTVL